VNPKSSNFVSATCALCQCSDCFTYASAVAKFRKDNLPDWSEKADALTSFNAIDMRQCYKADANKMTGDEFLRGVKLREDSPCVRYYSICCGTPLMIDYKIMPFLLVHQHSIAEVASTEEGESMSEAPFQKLTPTVLLNHRSAVPDSEPAPEGIPVEDGVSIGFVAHVLLRLLAGLISGKKASPIADQLANVPVSIGIESIGAAEAKREETK
jgi:hypothetical protein